jgi:phosphate transport system substrate-binding protein
MEMIRNFILFLLLIFTSCTSIKDNVSKIYITGSDTMYLLTIRLAAEYMKNHPNISVYVKSGGSSIGFEAIRNGNADICMSSRNIRSDEVKNLAEKYSTVGMSHLIAKDALSVYLNSKNSIENLTVNQLKDIFTCKITNWNQVGGTDDTIVTISRTSQSGTYEYFKSHILDDDEFCSKTISINSTESVVSNIINNPNAIGYGGIAFHTGVKHININGITPNDTNVRNDTYPIIRYLFFYTINSPSGEVKKFIDWVMSKEGQSIISNFGFISIWD